MRNSLKGTVLETITVDEFTPKSGVSEEVAVIAFRLNDDAPAQDLNTYIQRGYIDVIDAEVSPNPDEDGNYLVFVEVARNDQFLDVMLRLIKDVENLTGKMDWAVEPYSAEQAFALDDPALVQHLTFGNVTESIKRFLENADIAQVTMHEGIIDFGRVKGTLKDFDRVERIMDTYSLHESVIDLDSSEASLLESMLGSQYQVSKYGSDVFVAHQTNENAVVLSNLIFTHSR
tara:strand:- start:554 stop:1246 length:693 start_codon:yes stop_codon:yes gene_type:complete